jgi:nitrate reductase / nitrite oxidoreductase, alpha subunit
MFGADEQVARSPVVLAGPGGRGGGVASTEGRGDPEMTEGRALLRARQFFEPRQRSADGWNEASTYARDWEESYRRRWQHDRIVRSTHGVNCTGSCSWKIHVKDGLVTWETQQTDYPSNGPDTPDYEPRGCPRGASFSWYVYSPLRPK